MSEDKFDPEASLRGKVVKEIAEILGVRWQWVRGVCANTHRAACQKKHISAPSADTPSEQQILTSSESKPEPKSIARAELDARIWAAWKAGKSLDEISDELYAEGLYYSEKSVRVRLISQGAEL